MATRTVRLDDEAERVLAELRRSTGLSVSGVLKRGLEAACAEARWTQVVPFEVYRRLDLGPGGYAPVPARRAKDGIRELVRRKHGR